MYGSDPKMSNRRLIGTFNICKLPTINIYFLIFPSAKIAVTIVCDNDSHISSINISCIKITVYSGTNFSHITSI